MSQNCPIFQDNFRISSVTFSYKLPFLIYRLTMFLLENSNVIENVIYSEKSL